jgi:putative PEP-CTERM system histidine kinase
MESRQFEAFNRLSAYVIHDLKNILAQLSLMVSNAQKHKHNPEFIDDMVITVSNTVERMSKLMVQLRSGAGQTEQQEFDLSELLETVVSEGRHRDPAPSLTLDGTSFTMTCDRDRLQTVFGHLVQNAQEACDKNGVVSVCMTREHGAAIVEVTDNGAGMDEEFIRHRLFKPFDSTKGLTGMGIGAFESRDFIRSLGGNIHVQSTPGVGSVFRVYIPYMDVLGDDDNNSPNKVNNS